ncbi:hypothetical protein [Streptomyces sp. Inha503]|uniref:hypothetical protein n=1 Tax=Streptomyces sp. Inha503 TaxID=3383314 RepID=UPI0039A11541
MERVGRIAAWTALGVVVVGLAAYFSVVGLDDADRTASVVGVFVGIASLALAVAVELRSRRAPTAPRTGGGSDPSSARAASEGRSTTSPRYGGDHIDFSGGVFHGPVVGKRVERPPERRSGPSDGADPEAGEPL